MKTIAALILLVLCLHACRRFDEQAPALTLVSIDGTTGSELQAVAGENNNFTFRIQDDENLKQLKVNIKTLNGVHGHESSESEEPHPFLMVNQGVWDTVLIANLSGQDVLKEYTLSVPDTIAGGWELEVNALDEAGNLVIEDYMFQVFNPLIPQIVFSDILPVPVSDGRFELALNDSIVFDLAVFGTTQLTTVDITVSKGSLVNTISYPADQSLFELQDFVLHDFTTTGTYNVLITAADAFGKKNVMNAVVKVD
jgi:hypothetical protein